MKYHWFLKLGKGPVIYTMKQVKENPWHRNYGELPDLEFVDRVTLSVTGLPID